MRARVYLVGQKTWLNIAGLSWRLLWYITASSSDVQAVHYTSRIQCSQIIFLNVTFLDLLFNFVKFRLWYIAVIF